jgi:hypothetical protein
MTCIQAPSVAVLHSLMLPLQLADVHHHAKPAVELETVQAFCGTWVKVGMKQPAQRLCVVTHCAAGATRVWPMHGQRCACINSTQ